MKYTYQTEGVCASRIDLEVTDGVVGDVVFTGGCDGNHKGLCSLVRGMKAADAVERLEGIRCGFRPTSCPDQLAQALKAVMAR